MKKVIGMLALIALVGNIANAELLKNFKYNASLEGQGFVVNNAKDLDKDASDKFGEINHRVMVNAGFDLNEDVAATVTAVKCNRQMGDAAEKVNTLIDQFQFEQAYLTLKGVFGLDHQIGRQYYGNDGDINIYFGPANWYTRGLNAFNVALDGWTSSYKPMDKLLVSAMLGKVTEGNTTTNDDIDVYGLTASYDYSEIVKPAVYFYESKDYNTAAKVNDLQTIGVKANGEYMGVKYGAEYAMNMGQNRNLTSTTNKDYKGSAMKVNVGYDYDFMGKWNFMGEYAMGTGDKNTTNKSDKSFQDINANYRPGLIMGGIGIGAAPTAVNSLNNLTTWNLGAVWAPEKIQKLNLGLTYYSFSNTEKVGTVDHIGSEADLVATWNHSQNLAFKAGLAMFMPDDFVVTAGNDDSAKLASLYMNVKF